MGQLNYVLFQGGGAYGTSIVSPNTLTMLTSVVSGGVYGTSILCHWIGAGRLEVLCNSSICARVAWTWTRRRCVIARHCASNVCSEAPLSRKSTCTTSVIMPMPAEDDGINHSIMRMHTSLLISYNKSRYVAL